LVWRLASNGREIREKTRGKNATVSDISVFRNRPQYLARTKDSHAGEQVAGERLEGGGEAPPKIKSNAKQSEPRSSAKWLSTSHEQQTQQLTSADAVVFRSIQQILLNKSYVFFADLLRRHFTIPHRHSHPRSSCSAMFLLLIVRNYEVRMCWWPIKAKSINKI
jgi:hypothetical protein